MNTFKNGLLLADKIHFFLNLTDKCNGINTALVKHLSKDKYVEFCQRMNKVPLKAGVKNPKLFSPLFLENPVQNANIVYDDEIRSQWHPSTIINTLQDLYEV